MSDLSILFEVWVLARVVSQALDRVLAPSGLNAGDYALYSLLKRSGGQTPSQIALRSGTPVSSVSSRIAELEARGHLRRGANPDDGRSSIVELTEEGLSAWQSAVPMFGDLYREILADLGDDASAVDWALTRLDLAVRRATGQAPWQVDETDRPDSPNALHYGGKALTAGQEAELRRYVEWLRTRDQYDLYLETAAHPG